MKSISTVPEAAQAIRELQNEFATLRSKNWDRKQTRIVNAHPSVDPYDYVVRKELDNLGGGGTSITDLGMGYKECVFGIGISGNIVLGTDVCPHFISAYSLKPTLCLSKVKTAPQGADIQVQVYQNGSVALFTTPITIPVGSTAVQSKSDFALTNIAYKDWLTCSVLQTGTTVLGMTMTVYIRFKILAIPNG